MTIMGADGRVTDREPTPAPIMGLAFAILILIGALLAIDLFLAKTERLSFKMKRYIFTGKAPACFNPVGPTKLRKCCGELILLSAQIVSIICNWWLLCWGNAEAS
jgi:hypothetical protein